MIGAYFWVRIPFQLIRKSDPGHIIRAHILNDNFGSPTPDGIV